MFIPTPRTNHAVVNIIYQLMELLFQNRYGAKLRIDIGGKHNRTVGISFIKQKIQEGKREEEIISHIPNIFSLSTGESLLFSMFCSILRDYDLTRQTFSSFQEDIRGVVVIDEVDLHLHVDLQKNVLPKLIQQFPKVQFIMTTHSPLFLLGMDEVIGQENYEIYELPGGEKIGAERFKEFERAYQSFKNTKTYEQEIKELVRDISLPLLITEGKTDVTIIQTAWKKLYPNAAMPFKIISSGIALEESDKEGSAEWVRRTLEFLATIPVIPNSHTIIGLFDNDRKGNEQFSSLNAKIFGQYEIRMSYRKHMNKNMFGLLLPCPKYREKYVNPKPDQHYLEIEHYFSDEILKNCDKIGDPIMPGLEIFEIKGKKTSFAEKVMAFEMKEFEHFKVLFTELKKIGLGNPNDWPQKI